MRKHYDFSQAKSNPYAKQLKKEVTVRLDERTTDQNKSEQKRSGGRRLAGVMRLR